MTHVEMLPSIRAENEAWRAEVLPKFRAAQFRKAAERRHAAELMNKAFAEHDEQDRKLIERLTGFVIAAAEAAEGGEDRG